MRPNVRAGELERLLALAVCRRRGRPAVTDSTIGRQRQDSPGLEAAFYAVLLPLCVLTHRYIETPGQRLGRRAAQRLRPR